MIEGFLLGVIATAALASGVFFLKFWRKTHDTFFLALAVSFMIEGLNRVAMLFVTKPNEGILVMNLVRFVTFLLILMAIVKKNYGTRR